MAVEKIQVPDLGSDDTVEVIEVLVKAGDSVDENDSLIVLESDKAAMEVPAPKGGVVKELLIKVGDQVKTGSDLLMLEASGDAEADAKAEKAPQENQKEKAQADDKPAQKQDASQEKAPAKAAGNNGASASQAESAAGKTRVQSVEVPDLGDASDVEIIDILIKEGDTVEVEDGLITLETDKAAMDVPAPLAGKVVALKVKVGDKVSKGSIILDLETSDGAGQSQAAAAEPASEPAASAEPATAEPAAKDSANGEQAERPQSMSVPAASSDAEVYAGPAVRRLARELGVELMQVQGSGAKGRVVKEDVRAFVKSRLQGGAAEGAAAGSGVPGIPDQDFSRFGPVEEVEMSKLHRVTAKNMVRNWLNVPHVTQFDEADITELESFRAAQKALAEKKGIKLTPLPFIVKACAQALREHPQFNVSLHSSGMKLIRKSYVHIGVAVATPAGLMVPVVRDADKKSIWDIAAEIAALSAKAKDRKLTKEDMEGSCFTVSSLGNLGGTGFTPIVNAPEVAILGVSRADTRPVWRDKQFVPRTIMPFSLSYDHRAVNGVDGGQFCTYLGKVLGDIRLLLL